MTRALVVNGDQPCVLVLDHVTCWTLNNGTKVSVYFVGGGFTSFQFDNKSLADGFSATLLATLEGRKGEP